MVDDNALNLVNVFGQLEKFKRSIFRRIKEFLRITPSLSVEDKDDFQFIQDRIGLIETNQQAYFIEQQPRSSEEKWTQEESLNKDREIHLSTLNYTHQQITQLLEDIKQPTGLYARVRAKHSELFNKIILTLESMKDLLEKGRKKDESAQLSLSTEEKNFFSVKDFLFQVTQNVGGSYSAFNQGIDPLMGKGGEGNCYGHVMSWARKIINKGSDKSLMRADRQTRAIQLDQAVLNRVAFWERLYDKNLFQVLDEILENLKGQLVYGLIYRKKVGHRNFGHIMGIRRLPETGQLEFNDPNLGVFLFPNDLAFKLWFLQVFAHYYSASSPLLSLELVTLGQPLSHLKVSASVSEVKSEGKEQYGIPLHKFSEEHLKNFHSLTLLPAALLIAEGKIMGKEGDGILIKKLDEYREAGKQLLKTKLNFSHAVVAEKTDYEDEKSLLLKNVFPLLDAAAVCKPPLSKKQKNCLQSLQKRISEAPLCMPFHLLLHHFLAEKMEGSQETYKAVFDTLPESPKLLRRLLTYEISPLYLTSLQEALLLNVANFVKLNGHLQPYKDFLSAIEAYVKGEKTLKATLCLIQGSQLKKQGLFSSSDQVILHRLHSLLNRINLDDSQSLESANAQIERLIQDIPETKAAEEKTLPKNNKKPTK